MIHQPTIIVTLFLVVLTVALPRKYFLLPYVLAACLVPTDQRIIILGLDFTVLRILVVAGVLRILIYGEKRQIILNKLDLLILAWVFCGAAVYIIQWLNVKAVINRAGVLFDVIAFYWLFRQRIHSWAEAKTVFTFLAFCAIAMIPLVIFEQATGKNPFAILGEAITNVRAHRYRCRAAFPHPIVFGLFWATLMPLFVGLSATKKNRILYAAAAAAAAFMVIASASSTPLIVSAIVLLGLLGYKWRRHTPEIALWILLSLLTLHIIMKAPVWHLLARINVIGASTGWHRYNLIDKTIENLDEWVLLGCNETKHWGFGLEDVTNQFVLEGVRGGLITLLFFLTLIYFALKTLLSLALRLTDKKEQFLIWCFFVATIGHCAAFMGVSYFGQITMLWYMMLAVTAFLLEYNNFLQNNLCGRTSSNLYCRNPNRYNQFIAQKGKNESH